MLQAFDERETQLVLREREILTHRELEGREGAGGGTHGLPTIFLRLIGPPRLTMEELKVITREYNVNIEMGPKLTLPMKIKFFMAEILDRHFNGKLLDTNM